MKYGLRKWYGETLKGNFRKYNEDQFIFLENKDLSLAIVCDGMGGYNYSKLASNLVVKEISKAFSKYNFNNFKSDNAFDWLEGNIYHVLNKMLDLSLIDEDKKHMGTTCLATLITKHNMYIINIGDSRLYLYDDDILKKVTKDQNLLNLIGWEKCNRNPSIAKLLTSSLGPNKKLKIDRYEIKDIDNKIFLLSTDGFHDFVGDYSIKSILKQKISLKNKVTKLINLAVNNVSTDNITVLLIEI